VLALPIGHEAEMPDAHETIRQDVQKETMKKLLDPQREDAFLVFVGRVAPAEADLPLAQFNQPVIGDSDAVRVVAQVVENVFWPTKGPLGVDDPFMAAALMQQRSESPRRGELLQLTGKMQLAGGQSCPERVQEFSAKSFGHRLDRKKEVVARPDPVGAVRGNAAFRDHGMHMRMMLQFLVPGVENAEKADLGAKQPRITCELHQGFGAKAEQKRVNLFLVR
jgi:hypothetical protein